VKDAKGKACAGPRERRWLAKSEPSHKVEVLAKTTKTGDQHMNAEPKYVGLDVHQDTIVIAVAETGR
jgi:hypothetical protein